MRMNLILCGLPLSGKTTVGTLLAAQLGWRFVDTDRLIESAYQAKTGKIASVREIYREEGNDYFRTLEKEQLVSLKELSKHVIALGGGSLLNPDNAAIIQESGCLIYLRAEPRLLWGRVKERGVPAYLDPQDPQKSFEVLAKTRMPIYAKQAHMTIKIDHLSPEEIVKILINKVQYGQ